MFSFNSFDLSLFCMGLECYIYWKLRTITSEKNVIGKPLVSYKSKFSTVNIGNTPRLGPTYCMAMHGHLGVGNLLYMHAVNKA